MGQAFSSVGDASRHPDLVAPGTSVVSLRDPGSYIDTNYPAARIGTSYFLGSGSSQAAASSAETTSTKPTPMLNTRQHSASGRRRRSREHRPVR